MANFKSLKEIEAYLQNAVSQVLQNSTEIEDVLFDVLYEAIQDVVYNAYTPEEYERRGNEGGLSDKRNFSITGISVVGNSVKMTFENLTEGNDNLSNQFVGALIEFGEGYNGLTWENPNGVWAQSRPFSAEATRRLRENPTQLINAFKNSVRRSGFKVK